VERGLWTRFEPVQRPGSTIQCALPVGFQPPGIFLLRLLSSSTVCRTARKTEALLCNGP